MPAQVGRADLLRALALGRAGAMALDHTDTLWWGYVPPEQEVPRTEEIGESLELRLPPNERPHAPQTGTTRARSALRMPEVWEAERLPDRRNEQPEAPVRLAAFEALELQPADEPQGRCQDLLPLPRLARPLAAHLRRTQPGGIDLDALMRASARRQWPRRLPRLDRQAWPATLVVMIDASTDLFPYRYDMFRVVALLQALVPRAQLQVRMGADGPFGPWRGLHAEHLAEDSDDGIRPQPAATYLLLSDLGLLRPASEISRAWMAWLAHAQVRQCACVALAPVAAEDVDLDLAGCVRLLRWSPDSRLQLERGRPQTDIEGSSHDDCDALRELLACLSATLRMDPPMLRTLRQNSRNPRDASLEGRLWAHADVRSTTYACLRPERVEFHQAEFRRRSDNHWNAVRNACASDHAHWPLGMRVVDEMQQLTAAPRQDAALVSRLHHDLLRLAYSLRSEDAERDALKSTADYVLRRASYEARTHLASALDTLAQAAGQPLCTRLRWSLLQRGERLYVAPEVEAGASGPGVVLCSDIGQASPGELMRVSLPRKAAEYLRLPQQGLLALPNMDHGSAVILGGAETRLHRRTRMRGIWGWHQSDQGLKEIIDLPWPNEWSLPANGSSSFEAVVRDVLGNNVFIAVDRDRYGVVLGLRPEALVGEFLKRDAFIRFRYLEPGTFLQGSSEGTDFDDERPQHPVTLTRGLWLAETLCTQSLWQAVMGRNPSHFKGVEDAPSRPVENVSWDDVTVFLKTLQPMLPPGCEAVLPTESQWEYACRAGTLTEYWWGDDPDKTKANVDMDGNESWEDQEDGTSPVDRYPPNQWGLYDMHGNVWEWCVDGSREYAAEPVWDPEGGGAGDLRVVRGGSWFPHSGRGRAACRIKWRRRYAGRYLGFRFALRSATGPNATGSIPSRRARDDEGNLQSQSLMDRGIFE